MMFERFTDRVRKVMALANQEAQRFNHPYIGSEHILLGLVKEGCGSGANILKDMVDLRRVRLETEKLVKSGPETLIMGKLPQTPEVKQVIENAIEEARLLNHKYVGTEHLLLSLSRESEGIHYTVFKNLGIEKDLRCNLLRHILFTIEPNQDDRTIEEILMSIEQQLITLNQTKQKGNEE